ncbi:hypothetical protein V8G54_032724 [Vigna mungo]|uniref:Uncharacterized protein n=1 Tax=Vigna mungo TaxID=3915 RepID=A0AAQ3MMI7_VIGMU
MVLGTLSTSRYHFSDFWFWDISSSSFNYAYAWGFRLSKRRELQLPTLHFWRLGWNVLKGAFSADFSRWQERVFEFSNVVLGSSSFMRRMISTFSFVLAACAVALVE